MIALPATAAGPFLAARIPPVAAPLMIEFHGSSFCRRWAKVQSSVENMPPQTAKFPPMIGARSLMAARLPSIRRFMPCVIFSFFLCLLMWVITYTRSISEAFDGLKHGSADCAHGESTAAVVHNSPWTEKNEPTLMIDSAVP